MTLLDMKLASRLDSVGEYFFSKKGREIDQMRKEGKNVISLGIGSPDLPAAKVVIERLGVEAQNPNAHGYQPYVGTIELREAFAVWYKKHYNVELNGATEVLPLIGSKEGLMHCCMTYLNPGDKALIPNPGYPTYTSAVTLSGGVPVPYNLTEENGYQINFEEIEKAGLDGVKLLIANYPNMPTGTAPREGLFEDLVAFGKKHGILIIHDNPYSFIRNKTPESILSVEGAMGCVLELNSLSKSHNMAGWRIGAIIGAKERLDEIIRFKSNMDSGIFRPLQLAAVEALALGEEWFYDLNKIYREREAVGYKIMDTIGCKAIPGQTGLFIWGRLPEGSGDCFEFSDKILQEKHVFITPGGIFGSNGMNYVRISLCAPKEKLEEVLTRLSK